MVELVDTGDSKSPDFYRKGSSPFLGTIFFKKNIMFKKIKRKIKLVKIWVIIFWITFFALILSSIYLNYKVIQLEKNISKISIKK